MRRDQRLGSARRRWLAPLCLVAFVAACSVCAKVDDRIAFASDRNANFEIHVMDADGDNVDALTDHDARDSEPAWSPGGREVAFSSKRVGNAGQIWVVEPVTGDIRRVTREPGDHESPAWAPGGRTIVFRNWDRSGYLHTVDAAGGLSDRISIGDADGSPMWHPNGSRIVYSGRLVGDYQICTINSDGSDLVTLTDDKDHDLFPVWSPDGSRIAYTLFAGGKYDIYLMNLNGGNVERVTKHPGAEQHPAWSPDGREIAFVTERDGNAEIHAIDLESGALRNITRDPALDTQPAWAKPGAFRPVPSLQSFLTGRGALRAR